MTIAFACGGAGISTDAKVLVRPRSVARRIWAADLAPTLFMILRALVTCAAVAVEIARGFRLAIFLLAAAVLRFADLLQPLGERFLHERFPLLCVSLARLDIFRAIEILAALDPRLVRVRVVRERI